MPPTQHLDLELTASIATPGEVPTWSLWISTATAMHEMCSTASRPSQPIPKTQIWDCGASSEGLTRRATLFLKRRHPSWCGQLDLTDVWIPEKKRTKE